MVAPIPPAPAGSVATAFGFFIRRPLLVGYLAALAAAIAYGVVPALGKVVVVNYANPIITTAVTFLFGSLIMGAAVSHRLKRDIIGSDRRSLLLVGGGGVLMSTGVVLLYAALERTPVIVVSPIFSMNALVSIFMAHLFLKRIEKISRLLVFGTVLVVAGIVTVTLGVDV
jgi:drug/metabolite transporter (DMT)-like permease